MTTHESFLLYTIVILTKDVDWRALLQAINDGELDNLKVFLRSP